MLTNNIIFGIAAAGNGRRLDYRDREKRKKQIYDAKIFSAWDGVDMNSTMIRQYTDQNVYEAFLDRMHFIFSEFDNIFVSFSGGKDSGLLLNMLLDFRRKYYPHRRIGVFHQDFEAQYTVTTQYVENTFVRLEEDPLCTGSVCRWRRAPVSVIIRCTGIPGMIRNRSSGYGTCRNTLM